MTTNQLSVVSAFVTKLSNLIDFSISPIIKSTLGIYFQKSLPDNSPLIVNSNIALYAIRVLAASVTELQISVLFVIDCLRFHHVNWVQWLFSVTFLFSLQKKMVIG